MRIACDTKALIRAWSIVTITILINITYMYWECEHLMQCLRAQLMQAYCWIGHLMTYMVMNNCAMGAPFPSAGLKSQGNSELWLSFYLRMWVHINRGQRSLTLYGPSSNNSFSQKTSKDIRRWCVKGRYPSIDQPPTAVSYLFDDSDGDTRHQGRARIGPRQSKLPWKMPKFYQLLPSSLW